MNFELDDDAYQLEVVDSDLMVVPGLGVFYAKLVYGLLEYCYTNLVYLVSHLGFALTSLF